MPAKRLRKSSGRRVRHQVAERGQGTSAGGTGDAGLNGFDEAGAVERGVDTRERQAAQRIAAQSIVPRQVKFRDDDPPVGSERGPRVDRRAVRRRARAAVAPRRADRDTRPTTRRREIGRCGAARPQASTVTAVSHRGVGHPHGRLVGQRVLRRHQLPRRQPVPASPSSSPRSSAPPSRRARRVSVPRCARGCHRMAVGAGGFAPPDRPLAVSPTL
jgi:hypothetical protein